MIFPPPLFLSLYALFFAKVVFFALFPPPLLFFLLSGLAFQIVCSGSTFHPRELSAPFSLDTSCGFFSVKMVRY